MGATDPRGRRLKFLHTSKIHATVVNTAGYILVLGMLRKLRFKWWVISPIFPFA